MATTMMFTLIALTSDPIKFPAPVAPSTRAPATVMAPDVDLPRRHLGAVGAIRLLLRAAAFDPLAPYRTKSTNSGAGSVPAALA
jgi:hypothetical protein